MEGEATTQATRKEVPIPAISAEMYADMAEAAANVDDIVDEEPTYEWDRSNSDMFVGTCYPSMDEFRLAVRQHVRSLSMTLRNQAKKGSEVTIL